MALILQALFVALVLATCSDAAGIGSALKLSSIGKNFRSMTINTRSLEQSAEMAGYTFGVVGAYWRSNTLAAYAQMSRGEIEEAMETIQLAIATLTVWDLGQGVAYPVVHKLVDKIVKNKQLFRNTLQAYSDYRNVMKTGVLDDASRAATPDVLKTKLLQKKNSIGNAFQTDVAKIMKKSQMYTDLVTDLRGLKTAVKVVKWADVIAGPLFDAATVGVSAWQLAEAIKSNDPAAIAASSLSLASGLAGVTGFVVAALATTGSTLAAVAGPVGALIGAILGLASIMVEIFTALNPYRQIEQDVKMIKDLTSASKTLLDRNIKDLPSLVPQRNNRFEFSWVYQLNQGLLVENIQGRWKSLSQRVEFKMENPPKEENGYLVIGPKRHLDKSKYPSNLFWNPQGLVDIGYDFYGKKVTEQFNGATVIANTNLVAGKPNVELKGLDIVTYKVETDEKADNVIIGDMYDLSPKWGLATVNVKTGGGDDVIQINGLVGQPRIMSKYQQRGNPNAKAFIAIYSAYGPYKVMRRNNDVLSFEGMPKVQKREKKILGVEYEIFYGNLHYRVANDQGTPVSVYWGFVEGIKMFVGTPYNDIVEIMLGGMFFIRQTKGQNLYKMYLHPVLRSRTTIDDQSKTPGKIILESRNNLRITNRCLKFSKQERTLYIYQDNGPACADYYKAHIVFSQRANGFHVVRTEHDGIEMTLDQFPEKTSDAPIINESGNSQYFLDPGVERNQSNCLKMDVGVYPPQPHQSNFVFKTANAKNSKKALILSTDFINRCMHKANVSVLLLRSFELERPSWNLKFFVPRDQKHPECPGEDFQLPMDKHFARVLEQRNDGSDLLVADLHRDRRIKIDVNTELAKLDNRQSYHFDKEFEGQLGVSQDVLLKPPVTKDPPSTLKYQFDIKGGQQWDPDALIFTEELRNWLKDNGRRVVLKNKPKGAWKLEITREDGTATHSLSLKNIERIDYEPRDGSLRQPIVLDLATEAKKRIDLETFTVYKLLTPEADDCEG